MRGMGLKTHGNSGDDDDATLQLNGSPQDFIPKGCSSVLLPSPGVRKGVELAALEIPAQLGHDLCYQADGDYKEEGEI